MEGAVQPWIVCTITVNRCHDSIAFLVILPSFPMGPEGYLPRAGSGRWRQKTESVEMWRDFRKQRPLIGRWATAEEAGRAKTISPTAAACPLWDSTT